MSRSSVESDPGAKEKRASGSRSSGRSGQRRSSLASERLNTEQFAEAILAVANDDFSLVHISEEQAREIWASILELISDALLSDLPVVLRNVGTLESFKKKAQRYRHPVTGEMQVAKSKRHIRFVLSPTIRRKLRGDR